VDLLAPNLHASVYVDDTPVPHELYCALLVAGEQVRTRGQHCQVRGERRLKRYCDKWPQTVSPRASDTCLQAFAERQPMVEDLTDLPIAQEAALILQWQVGAELTATSRSGSQRIRLGAV
jgi:hypothetical protein